MHRLPNAMSDNSSTFPSHFTAHTEPPIEYTHGFHVLNYFMYALHILNNNNNKSQMKWMRRTHAPESASGAAFSLVTVDSKNLFSSIALWKFGSIDFFIKRNIQEIYDIDSRG